MPRPLTLCESLPLRRAWEPFHEEPDFGVTSLNYNIGNLMELSEKRMEPPEMNVVRDTLDIEIEYFTGREEGEDDAGHPYYVAACDVIGLVADGETFEELLVNIQEALDAAMEGEDTVTLYNVVPQPRIILHMEMPNPNAQAA